MHISPRGTDIIHLDQGSSNFLYEGSVFCTSDFRGEGRNVASGNGHFPSISGSKHCHIWYNREKWCCIVGIIGRNSAPLLTSVGRIVSCISGRSSAPRAGQRQAAPGALLRGCIWKVHPLNPIYLTLPVHPHNYLAPLQLGNIQHFHV